MKRIEGSFVPSLNNVNLCNTTQIVLFCFLKIVSSQYNSSTLTQLKTKQTNKKEPKLGRQSFSVLNIDIELIKDLLCVYWCMCIKYIELHTWITEADNYSPGTPHPHPHSLRLGGWLERPFPYFFKRPPPYPHSTAWLEEQSGTLQPMAHKILRVPSPGFT